MQVTGNLKKSKLRINYRYLNHFSKPVVNFPWSSPDFLPTGRYIIHSFHNSGWVAKAASLHLGCWKKW